MWRPVPPVAHAALAALALTALPAAAQVESQPVSIEVDPGTRCTTSETATARVFARTARVRAARPQERARRFVLATFKRGGRTRGTLVVHELDGKSSTREVAGASCAEVVSALVLVTALAIDPEATLTESAPPVSEARTEAAPPAGEATEAAPPAGEATEAAPPAGEALTESAPPASATAAPPKSAAPPPVPAKEVGVDEAPVAPPSQERLPASDRARTRLAWSIGAGAQASFAAAPGLIGLALGVELQLVRPESFDPALRLWVEASLDTATASSNDGRSSDVDFTLALARLELAPFRLVADALDAAPLLGVEAGVRWADATGTLVTTPTPSSLPWLAGTFGAAGGATLGPLRFELRAAAVLPAFRDLYVVGDRTRGEPELEVHEIPPISWFAAAGLWARL